MVLGIDASQANRQIRSGTEWYAWHLIEEFKKMLGARSDLKVRLYARGPLQSDIANNLPENFEVRVLGWPLKYFWGQVRLSWEMLTHPPDVLFCPAHTVPLTSILSRQGRGRMRVLTTLHDVGFKDYPELYDKLSLWYHRFSAWLAVKYGAHIFTISEFSKERIIENYKVDPNKITVTYLGINLPPTPSSRGGGVLEDLGLKEEKYILYVGRLEPKKNILGMIKGYEQFIQSWRPLPNRPQAWGGEIPTMVLAGRKVRTDDAQSYLDDRPELKNKIRLLNYISEQEKWALYRGAKMFLFATLYEGFGLPILEAQATGTPVITSNVTSNPEIAGAGAVLVTPGNPHEIAAAITAILRDNNLRQDKIRLGLENVKRFSWAETARSTLNVILSF